jgi:hypothetical protein
MTAVGCFTSSRLRVDISSIGLVRDRRALESLWRRVLQLTPPERPSTSVSASVRRPLRSLAVAFSGLPPSPLVEAFEGGLVLVPCPERLLLLLLLLPLRLRLRLRLPLCVPTSTAVAAAAAAAAAKTRLVLPPPSGPIIHMGCHVVGPGPRRNHPEPASLCLA